MNNQYDLSSFESVKSILGQIEKEYIVSENDKALLLKRIEEYFGVKENSSPSSTAEKWAEISKILDTLELKT